MPHTVELPRSSTGEYQLFVSGDYEIRLFGDPLAQQGTDAPSLRIKLDVAFEEPDALIRETSQDVVCDFVDGFAFGSAIGIGLRSTTNWMTVTKAVLTQELDGFGIELVQETKLAPGQTRIIPLKLQQHLPIWDGNLELGLTVESEILDSTYLKVSLPLRQLPRWTPDSHTPIKASFFYAGSNPTIFTVLPPRISHEGAHARPILALHGAGVDILQHNFWPEAMPSNNFSWIIMPAGRTSWGLDWHGPSAQEAWGAVSALSEILQANDAWKDQAFPNDSKVVLIGHSNGGQGVWHMATHFPDRVAAAVPAAAYIKSQAYIPLTQARYAHYMDPMLRAILESSLTPDDNDLHLSNIAHSPVLAVHGGSDGNVPAWHSRELVSVLRTLEPNGNASLKEDRGQDHWYNTVLNNQDVQQFVSHHTRAEGPKAEPPLSFTLTVSNPSETDSLYGWKIHSLFIAGRLGILRIDVQGDGIVKVSSNNVQSFSVRDENIISDIKALIIGSQTFSRSHFTQLPVVFTLASDKWTTESGVSLPFSIPTRLQAILTTVGPINIVFDEEQAFSLAKRLAHDLHLYHRLDSELISAGDNSLHMHSTGNSVVIGTLQSVSVQRALREARTPFRLYNGSLVLGGKPLPTNTECK
ncbi:hypothetical protein MD484_g3582, partial [Candolleomyces efflorescens]